MYLTEAKLFYLAQFVLVSLCILSLSPESKFKCHIQSVVTLLAKNKNL